MARRETPRIKDAYREFLKLGINRSIESLHERLTQIWPEDAPGVGTLRVWQRDFGWIGRAQEDDELINRRAMERIREKMAVDMEERRRRRLALADVQQKAAFDAMVVETEKGQRPVDLLRIDPSTLRAINDTIKLANETQRIDSGEATTRLGREEMSVMESNYRAASSEDVIDELHRFILTDEAEVGVPNDDVIDAEQVYVLPDSEGDMA